MADVGVEAFGALAATRTWRTIGVVVGAHTSCVFDEREFESSRYFCLERYTFCGSFLLRVFHWKYCQEKEFVNSKNILRTTEALERMRFKRKTLQTWFDENGSFMKHKEGGGTTRTAAVVEIPFIQGDART